MTAERTNQATGLAGVSDAEVTRLAARAISILLTGKTRLPENSGRWPGIEGRLDLLCDAFLSDRHELRSRILARMRQDGIPVEDIIDVVLPEVARSAGQRWMDDDISFADVTIVTARLQETVRALGRVPRGAYPARLEDKVETAQARPRVLLIIPRTEEHTMGAFVVADQIRRNGCEVDIAMDVHARQVAEMVRKTRYHMVGITAAGRRSIASAKELVDTIRASVTRVTPIVLGGSVVEGVASLKAMTGVDYVVCDASAALKACGLLERKELLAHEAPSGPPHGRDGSRGNRT
jgi:methanogenic corrinoid protein MtbC1